LRECAPDDRLRERDPGPITTGVRGFVGLAAAAFFNE